MWRRGFRLVMPAHEKPRQKSAPLTAAGEPSHISGIARPSRSYRLNYGSAAKPIIAVGCLVWKSGSHCQAWWESCRRCEVRDRGEGAPSQSHISLLRQLHYFLKRAETRPTAPNPSPRRRISDGSGTAILLMETLPSCA
jgi:hypothetical protein